MCISKYVSQSRSDGAEPSHNLSHALYSSMDYTNRALDRTRSTQRYIFGDAQISLIELLNNLYGIITDALDELSDSDGDTLKRVMKELHDFMREHNEYLIQQNKLYLAERGKLFG